TSAGSCCQWWLKSTRFGRYDECLRRRRRPSAPSTGFRLGSCSKPPRPPAPAAPRAAEADFLSVGTNDLTQYVLAADRGNAAVSARADALHPAVLRLIRRTTEGGREHDCWTGV